jgi:1,2-diacylglycerol 3-alpha-glucosyltransferase
LEKANVFIICTGLGHVKRGYESFTRECYDALKNNDQFKLYLLKGGGRSIDNEIKIACLKRDSKSARIIASALKKGPYFIEQATFLIGMIPAILKYKPSVIYYSDFILGTFLWHLRRFFKFRYKLLFTNGSPNGPPFKTEDHVQQLLPIYFEEAINGGEPPLKHTLLPLGFQIDVDQKLRNIGKRHQLRTELGFYSNQKIVLSVAAINKRHKRVDYVIDELAKLPDDYFLVILGQADDQTTGLIKLAEDKLPGRHFISTVPYEKVQDYYIISDYFVLASLKEGFGRVLIEAVSYGLPCIVNDCINARQVLGEFGIYINMKEENALQHILLRNDIFFEKDSLVNAMYNDYSWHKLKAAYIDMISKLLN